MISFPLDIYSVARLLDHILVLFLISLGTVILFSIVPVSYQQCIMVEKSALLSTSSPVLATSCPSDNRHPRCEVISHGVLTGISLISSILLFTHWLFACLLWEKKSLLRLLAHFSIGLFGGFVLFYFAIEL